MAQYKDWFAVDVEKRGSMTRSRSLGQLLKELLANSLDASARRWLSRAIPVRVRGGTRLGCGLLTSPARTTAAGAQILRFSARSVRQRAICIRRRGVASGKG